MLAIEEGKDYIIEDRNQLPYQVIGNLGHGHSGNVEKIKDVNTGAIYACKTIRIYGARLKDSRRKIFDNEIKIIRSLAGHHHVIRVFATYVSKREVGLILQPVADQGDLEDFLGSYNDSVQSLTATDGNLAKMASILERAFGCLASGLAFMHKQKIRHKDVKPRNILVHNGSVVYTDFGYSLDSSQLDYSTTYGRPEFLTRRYSAPEVIDHDRRNSLSDVYSLGCVFLDLLSALTNEFEIQSDRCFYEIVDIIFKQLKSTTISPRFMFLVNIIFSMTLPISHRWKADEVSKKILEQKGFACEHCQPTPRPSFAEGYKGSKSSNSMSSAERIMQGQNKLREVMAALGIQASNEERNETSVPKMQNEHTTTDLRSTSTARPSKDVAVVKSALVLYDYEVAEDNEVDLREGEYITEIDMVDEDWWIGTNSSGDRGLFPCNYVELVENTDTSAKISPATTTVPNSKSASSTPAERAKPTATSMYDYDAAEDNELSFPEGVTITDLEFPDEDWWMGVYNGVTGLFPSNYVELDH